MRGLSFSVLYGESTVRVPFSFMRTDGTPAAPLVFASIVGRLTHARGYITWNE